MTSDDTPWLDADQMRVWRQWVRVLAVLPARLGAQLAHDSGLSLPDYEVLVTVSETPDHRIRVAALADALQWERSRLSHHVTRMEKRGLVTREACPDDRRGAFVALTDVGLQAVRAAAPGHVRAVRANLFDVLTPAQTACLDEITASLLTHLDEGSAGRKAGAATM